MSARVADEQDGQHQACQGENNTQVERLWPEPVARRQVAGGERRQRDRDVTSELIEAHSQATPGWTDEVDLHDHRRGPAQPLIDSQQDIGRDDPAPGRSEHDQHWHRQADNPPRYQNLFASDPIAHPPGEQVRQRLRHTERDDE